jgi:hypothetical protein
MTDSGDTGHMGTNASKFLLLLLFWVLLDSLLVGSKPSPTVHIVRTGTFSQSLAVEAAHVEKTDLLFHRRVVDTQKRILESQVGDRFQLVEYRLTWPEYVGYGLAGLFILSGFWFLFSVATEEWTQERANYVVRSKLSAFSALYYTYGIAALLGWVWMEAWPFLSMGVVLTGFGVILKKIPLILKPACPPARTRYLHAKVNPAPKKIKVNPLIRKMFEKRSSNDPHRDEEMFQYRFLEWLQTTKTLEPWKHEVALQSGRSEVESILRFAFHNGDFCLGTWELLEILSSCSCPEARRRMVSRFLPDRQPEP